MQHLPAITHTRFSLIRVRSPLLTESLLFSLPVGTEMFHFPTFPLPALYIQAGVTRTHECAWRGFPIRKSTDHSSLISSPRLIADCYVLLRLQMPRHPPFALKDLQNHMSHQPKSSMSLSIRCSRPLCSSQSTGGAHPATPNTGAQKWAQQETKPTRPGPSGPNSVHATAPGRHHVPSHPERDVLATSPINDGMSNVPPMSCQQDTFGPTRRLDTPKECQMLLRKEVIQPHLPVRLPCYDLVLITDPTFDGSLHKG